MYENVRRTMRVGTKAAILFALAVQGATLAITCALYGTGPEGILIAARNTARASAILFSIALAMRSRPPGTAMMDGFAAGHAVHYLTVAYLASVAVHHQLQQFSVRSVTVISFGVLLLTVIVITNDKERKLLRLLNGFAVYSAWLVFAGGAALNASGMLSGQRRLGALVPIVPLLAGLLIHSVKSRQGRSRASAAAV